jgi:hypothetical protein
MQRNAKVRKGQNKKIPAAPRQRRTRPPRASPHFDDKKVVFPYKWNDFGSKEWKIMNGPLKKWVSLAGLAVLLLGGGCIGPQYTKHDMVVSGKAAPKIHGPRDPALPANLSTNLWPRQPFPGRAAEVGTTLFKDSGIQGWKDYHLNARATGVSLQRQFTSGPYLTIDLRLQSLTVKRVPVPLRGPRYMRVVIFLPKTSVAAAVYERTNPVVVAQGRLVWNFDGWFEIHPQKTGDVTLAPVMSSIHSGRSGAATHGSRCESHSQAWGQSSF